MTWYAVQIAPHPDTQRLAVRVLRAQGIEVFWPHYLAQVRHGTRRGYALRSWLPRYLFVRDGPFFSAGAVNTTMGVSTLIYVGDYPVPIPEDVIWELKSMADPSGCIPRSSLGAANMVRIKGENFFECLKALGGLKAKVWAAGMTAAVRKAA